MTNLNKTSEAATSLNSDELTNSSATSVSKLANVASGVLMGVQNALNTTNSPFSARGTSSLELSDRQQELRQMYLKLVNELVVISTSDLQPGHRVESLKVLSDLSLKHPNTFTAAFERVFHTTSRKISDRAKASALRYSSNFARPDEHALYTRLLISRLDSDSPSEASAAATALGDFADAYSAPALSAVRPQIRWSSVLSDLDETINEIKSE